MKRRVEDVCLLQFIELRLCVLQLVINAETLTVNVVDSMTFVAGSKTPCDFYIQHSEEIKKTLGHVNGITISRFYNKRTLGHVKIIIYQNLNFKNIEIRRAFFSILFSHVLLMWVECTQTHRGVTVRLSLSQPAICSMLSSLMI